MKLIIDLTARLPDINSEKYIPDRYNDYGRFGVLRSGGYWFAGVRSCHPDVLVGFYWAVNWSLNTLYISPRGAATDIQSLDDSIIFFVMKKLGLERFCKDYIIKK